MFFACYIWIKKWFNFDLGQVLHLLFLHLEIEKSETSELSFAVNQKGLPASRGLSTTKLPYQNLRDLPGILDPEEIVKSIDCADLACNRINIVKS